MDNNSNSKKQNDSIDRVYFENLSEEQKKEVVDAYVEGRKAEARAKVAAADKAEADVKKSEAETENVKANTSKTERERKKLTTEQRIAIGVFGFTVISYFASKFLGFRMMDKIHDHSDNSIARLTEEDEQVKRTTISETAKSMFK